MRGLPRLDLLIATDFVLAAAAEATALHRTEPGMLALGWAGAPVLAVLAVRRRHPTATLATIAGFAVLGTVLQVLLWPDASDSAGVWMFALMLACYSLGAHATGTRRALGMVAPLLVVLSANVPTMSGWAMVNGIAFVTMFIGVLPTAVGAVVRRRREALRALTDQRARIIGNLRAESTTAVLAERLRTTERLRPVLLDGLRDLARQAEDATEVTSIELRARDLLSRTRHEVLALTAPVDEPVTDPDPPKPDHLSVLRTATQPWTVVGAGALGAGLAVESIEVLPLDVPDSVAVLASFLVAAPVALLSWRPLPAAVLASVATLVFSRAIAPLDGTLSGSALALTLAFAVAALSSRRAAVVGLVVCWLGAGPVSDDPLGVAAILLAAWLGGLAVNEVSDLVEQSHANNRQLAEHAEADARRAVVEERLRLARELHDVLGHSLTVVTIQAGAARRLEDTDPARAAETRRTIAEAAREGLAALDERDPQADDLRTLLDRTRAAGLPVEVDVDDLTDVGAAIRHVAERVVQESLTNVLRHAPGARAQVRVRKSADGVDVVVRNSPPAGPGPGPGSNRGLVGIRERVGTLDGSVHWGPDDDGGFTVRAHLPAQHLSATVG